MAQPNVVKGFVSPQTAKYLNDYLRPRSYLNPRGLLNVYLKPLDISKGGSTEDYVIHDLINMIESSIASQFGFKQSEISLDRMNYQVLQKGEELGWHADAYGGVDGYEDNYYSALLYLTDDYSGGEIHFYENNSGDKKDSVAYKPEAGTLIFFKGDRDYPHSVNEVIDGERANIILFYGVTPTPKEDLHQK
jgi:Rps23 Pro-64 3,4-dihydroxylase Tpa1-like proline 4-hydroxylase